MAIELCGKPISGRSRYETLIERRCYRSAGHTGKCDEYPFLAHLLQIAPRVAAKVKRDATKTTGAAWKSDDAGPNRIDRWVMLLPDDVLKNEFGINIASMKPQVRAKLRDKAATYEDCMDVAAMLTLNVYEMTNAPIPPPEIRDYLIGRFERFEPNSTRCIVCLDYLDFISFDLAQRGRAHIETAHANPRMHSPSNVGFAHRECNIAQGSSSLSEFYDWMRSILARVDEHQSQFDLVTERTK
ncbi:hypothetical protein [Oceanibaculum nanhaiense]|uniref:hypothetical protein n=1 Tax=Oceanibaculum nanhaiense TaxID=1909734 RepID=UPI0011213E4A|nr:hypothetical protein [Oceanibaculum nanhaiense]|tara:strand:+ start:415 stop:1140 length:726 start_codon:yes stop_codon:yes gene_type:complete